MAADKKRYLESVVREMQKIWPDNRSITIACHGHSIPCGYMAENVTRFTDAYPHLLHEKLAERFPHSVINVIVTAIGGENSVSGAKRFQSDVLSHRPDIVTIDYGRNDMFLSKEETRSFWNCMIQEALAADVKVLLITPAPDCGEVYYEKNARKLSDKEMAEIIREAAEKFSVGLVDAYEGFDRLLRQGHARSEYAVSVNHLNRRGHEIIADTIMEWVPYL